MTTTLREQVAEAIRDEIYPPGGVLSGGAWDELIEAGDAAIGVVLGVVADEIKALPGTFRPGVAPWTPPGPVKVVRDDVLAVVERLRG